MYGMMAGGGGPGSSAFGCMEQVQMSELNSLKQSSRSLVYDKSIPGFTVPVKQLPGNNHPTSSSSGLGTLSSALGTLSTPKEYLYFPSSCDGTALEAVNSTPNTNMGTTGIQSHQRSGPSVEQLEEGSPEDSSRSVSGDTAQYTHSLNTSGRSQHHVHPSSSLHPSSSHLQPGQFRVSANATSATSNPNATAMHPNATPAREAREARERTYEVPFLLTKVCYISLSVCLFPWEFPLSRFALVFLSKSDFPLAFILSSGKNVSSHVQFHG